VPAGECSAISTPGARREAGRALRRSVPRSAHAEWKPAAGRDPLASIAEQERGRIAELLPLRHERMSASPFAFMRGTSALAAADIAGTPSTGLRVQACGDAHVANFGLHGFPERNLVFGLNDFDETLPAPFEWDVKRFASSVAVVALHGGLSKKQAGKATADGVAAYREAVGGAGDRPHEAIAKARRQTNGEAFEKLTRVVRGRRLIADDPPLVEHLDGTSLGYHLSEGIETYLASLAGAQRSLVRPYRVADWARKVVGIGSVGTECDIVLLLSEGGDGDDPLFLQVKESKRSVLEPFAGAGPHRHQGKRVVMGQRLMQAGNDPFLGWARFDDRDVYVRGLRDRKGSGEVEKLPPGKLPTYAAICGQALGRAHSRSGDAVAIAGYLGRSDSFDSAVTEFALAYADQNEHDYAQFLEAVDSGRVATSEQPGRRA